MSYVTNAQLIGKKKCQRLRIVRLPPTQARVVLLRIKIFAANMNSVLLRNSLGAEGFQGFLRGRECLLNFAFSVNR